MEYLYKRGVYGQKTPKVYKLRDDRPAAPEDDVQESPGARGFLPFLIIPALLLGLVGILSIYSRNHTLGVTSSNAIPIAQAAQKTVKSPSVSLGAANNAHGSAGATDLLGAALLSNLFSPSGSSATTVTTPTNTPTTSGGRGSAADPPATTSGTSSSSPNQPSTSTSSTTPSSGSGSTPSSGSTGSTSSGSSGSTGSSGGSSTGLNLTVGSISAGVSGSGVNVSTGTTL